MKFQSLARDLIGISPLLFFFHDGSWGQSLFADTAQELLVRTIG